MIPIDPRWDVRPLGEIVDILDSQRVPVSAKERAARPGNIPYYGAAGQVGYIDRPLFDEPLLLLGEDGVQFLDPVKSKAYLIDGPAWVNNHAHVLRVRSDVDRRFLNFYLNAADYRGLANGTTRLKLTQAAMRRIPVPIPPVDEQRRIVAILEDHLSRLHAAENYIRSAQRRCAGLHDQLLASELQKAGSQRVALGDLVESGLSNGRSVPTEVGGFPVLRLTALRNARIDLAERKGGAWTAGDAHRFLVRRGDFLIARGNGSLRLVGRGGLVDEDPDPVAFPDTLIRARPDAGRILPNYLALVWNAPTVRRQIERAAKTTAGIYKVNQKDLGLIEVPVLSLDDQAKVVAAVDETRGKVSQLTEAVDRTRGRSAALRRALLATAFSGRLTGSVRELPKAEEMIGA